MDNYWLKRTKARLDRAESIGLVAMQKMLPVYDQALENIKKEIERLYDNYADDKGLKVEDLKAVLTGAEQEEYLRSIQKGMMEAGMDTVNVFDKKYIGRLTRLEALKQQIYWEIQKIATQEKAISDEAYKKIIEESYTASKTDMREYVGENYGGFQSIDPLIRDEILRTDWAGSTYDKRIWHNSKTLNKSIQELIPSIIGGGALVGSSYYKVARQIEAEFDVGRYDAMRLVRTETNYFQNQAELQSYIDEGVEHYEYTAILDKRTSEVCERLDGEVFKVRDAQAGFNYPPMHPNCRSDTVIVFDEEAKSRKVWTPTEWEEFVKEEEEKKSEAKREKILQNWIDKYKESEEEHSAVLNRKTGKILGTNEGNYGEIELTEEQLENLEGNILIHNHPPTGEFTTFSAPDIEIAIKQGAYQTIVVGKEGYYSMRFGDVSKYSQGVRDEMADDIKDMYIKDLKSSSTLGKYKTAEEYVTAMFVQDPDNGMAHRPSYFVEADGDFDNVMPSASNLLKGDVLPRDVYEHPEWSISPQHKDKSNQESWQALLDVRDKPEADITIYRASTKEGLRTGDWITLSKEYADQHAISNTDGGKVFSYTVKAKDVVFAGDDVNEFGYFPKDKLMEEWEQAQGGKKDKSIWNEVADKYGFTYKEKITGTPKLVVQKPTEEIDFSNKRNVRIKLYDGKPYGGFNDTLDSLSWDKSTGTDNTDNIKVYKDINTGRTIIVDGNTRVRMALEKGEDYINADVEYIVTGEKGLIYKIADIEEGVKSGTITRKEAEELGYDKAKLQEIWEMTGKEEEINEDVKVEKETKKKYEPIILGKKNPVEVKLEDYHREFLEDREIYLTQEGYRSELGNYNHSNRELYVRSRLAPTMKQTYLHEFGHSVDYMNADTVIIRGRKTWNSYEERDTYNAIIKENRLSLKKDFIDLWKGENNSLTLAGGHQVRGAGWSEETKNIVKERLKRTFIDRDIEPTDELLTKAYAGEDVSLGKNRKIKTSFRHRSYMNSDEEVFAEGWGQYIYQPKEMKKYAPEFYKYFEGIDKLLKERYE